MLCCFSAFADDTDIKDVYTIKLGSGEVVFGLDMSENPSMAVFYDENKVELNILFFAPSEYNKMKRLAYESKVLVKSVESRSEYERKNIYSKIINKITAIAPLAREEYILDSDSEFERIIFFVTDSFSESKDVDAFISHFLSGDAPEAESRNKLVVWSFTDELEGMIDNYYKPAHPDVAVEYSLTPTDQFPLKLDPVLAAGQGCPDVFALEAAFVRKYVESGLLLPLDDVYAEVKGKMTDYPMKIGSFDGHVYAMSWQVCPGALFYRRSIAKKYLGTDDPKEVQKYVKDFDAFVATARLLKKKSNGTCRIVSSAGDIFIPAKAARKVPWVINDRLTIDPAMEKYMDMCKALHDENMDGRVSQWSEGWYDGMQDTLEDERGNPLEVFCYLLPTWGLHYVLKTIAPGTSGDWAMCAGPANYCWGGTWIGAWKNTKNPAAAKEMIKYLATDDTFLAAYAKASGDYVGNLKVQDALKYRFSEPYLAGQKPYAEFCEMAKGIDGSLIQGSDQQIEALFNEAVTAYANGEKSKKQALDDFKTQVSSTLSY